MSSVTLGMTTKGINSTSRQISGGVTVDAKLKDPVCGLHSPVFKLKGLDKAYNNYNYCIWRGRYYWVDEIVFLTNDIQEVHCRLDPLATFKGAIDSTEALVIYGDKGHWNDYCDDPRFNPEFEDPAMNQNYDIYWGDLNASGTVIMTFMDCGNGGGVKTVALSVGSFLNMLDDLYALFGSASYQECWAYLGGCGSWRENIISCVWIPFSMNTATHTGIRLGGVLLSHVTCSYISTHKVLTQNNGSINFNWHLYDNYPYLKNNRWTSCQINTMLGYTSIPIDSLVTHSTIYVSNCVECNTGNTMIVFHEKNTDDWGEIFAVHSGCLGLNLMGDLGSGHGIGQQASSIAKNIASFAANMAIGMNAGMGAIQTAQTGINSAMGSGIGSGGNWNQSGLAAAWDRYDSTRAGVALNTVSTGINGVCSIDSSKQITPASGVMGSNSAALFMKSDITHFGDLVIKTFRQFDLGSYDTFCDKYGYPVNKYLTLSSVTGFCKCAGAFIDNVPGASPADISSINSFLNSGIILED